MKRYELMSKEEIIETICARVTGCNECEKGEECMVKGAALGSIKEVLFEEVRPRIEKINNIQELRDAAVRLILNCKGECESCKYRDDDPRITGRFTQTTAGCFERYLEEYV